MVSEKKICSKCGFENIQNAIYCKKCGAKLKNNTNGSGGLKKEHIIIVALIVSIVCVSSIFATYFLLTENYKNTAVIINDTTKNVSNESSQVNNNDATNNGANSNSNSGSWHQVQSYHGGSSADSSGSDHYNIKVNGKAKVVLSGMPVENYKANSLGASVSINGQSLSSLGMSWGSHDDTVSKSDSVEGGSAGNLDITVNYDNMDYWDIVVYEYS